MMPTLLQEKRQFRVAISLYSLEQNKREMIVPTAKYNRIENILDLLLEYSNKFNKRISFEYILFKEFNDRIEDVYALSKHLTPFDKKLVHINLIM